MIVGTSPIFLFGWFLMKRLDYFLDENQKRIEEETEQQPEPCVWLNGDISPDELVESIIKCRRNRYGFSCIIFLSEGRRKEAKTLNG